MKGKYANRAENRRADIAEAEVARLRAELKQVRDVAAADAKQLREENTKLTAEMVNRAGELATAEVQRQIEAFHHERAMRGLSDDIATHLMLRKDRMMLNACRYVSMTTGRGPLDALECVITWATDKDFYAAPNRTDLLLELGVPADGWVASQLARVSKHWEKTMDRRRRRAGEPGARHLDFVDEHLDDFEQIHPKYNPKWYPRNVRYGGIVVEDGRDLVDELIQGGPA